MKYVKQLLIIILISFLGELLNYIIPLPVPGSIYGMILMFVLLCSGILKLEQVKKTGKFLLDIMPIMFIPSAVGIMSQFEQLKDIWFQIILITITTTIITIAVTGLSSQAIIRWKKRKESKKNECSE